MFRLFRFYYLFTPKLRSFHFIILAELSTIVCNEDKVSLLLEQAHSCKGLKNLVKIGAMVTQEQSDKAKELGLKLISLAYLEVSHALNIPRHRSLDLFM